MILETLEKWRRRPLQERQKIVSMIAIIVMVAITVVWLPLFFMNVSNELAAQRTPPLGEPQESEEGIQLSPPYAE